MPDTSTTPTSTIWLEVTNVRQNKDEPPLQIQVKGDRADREPEWWKVSDQAYIGSTAAETYRTLSENLDKKRIVLAALGAAESTLECKHLRIQYAESASR